MKITQKDIASLPTSKPIAWLFILSVTVVMIYGVFTGKDLPPNITGMLTYLGPIIIAGYFSKSAYEYRLDKQYGITEAPYPTMEVLNDNSDEG